MDLEAAFCVGPGSTESIRRLRDLRFEHVPLAQIICWGYRWPLFLVLTYDKADASYRMNELLMEPVVHFPAQPGDMNVDDVVQRRVAAGFFPDVTGQHFAGDHAT